MLTLKQGLLLSAIIDKLGIKIKTTEKNEKGEKVYLTQEEIGADLLIQIASKAHRAEKEIYALVAEMRGITPAEAAKINLLAFAQELLAAPGLMDFFKSAAKSRDPG